MLNELVQRCTDARGVDTTDELPRSGTWRGDGPHRGVLEPSSVEDEGAHVRRKQTVARRGRAACQRIARTGVRRGRRFHRMHCTHASRDRNPNYPVFEAVVESGRSAPSAWALTTTKTIASLSGPALVGIGRERHPHDGRRGDRAHLPGRRARAPSQARIRRPGSAARARPRSGLPRFGCIGATRAGAEAWGSDSAAQLCRALALASPSRSPLAATASTCPTGLDQCRVGRLTDGRWLRDSAGWRQRLSFPLDS